MKLFGNSRKSRHTGTQVRQEQPDYSDNRSTKRKNRGLRALIIILAVILIILLAVLAWIKFGVKPPDVIDNRPNQPNIPAQTEDNEDEEQNEVKPEKKNDDPQVSRPDEKYTFLILGSDDGNGNTDTIMVATFDVTNHKLNIVSIPRDTMVNVSWAVKKVNTLYAYSGVDGMMDHFADILGFRPDFYINVDLLAFSTLVDAVGGIDYYVPQRMYYEDPYQDLYIDFAEGMQHLDGEDALKVVRFRSGYANADIGRIATQQDFLKTAAEQILANKNSLKITSLAEIFIKYVKTDLTNGNVVWFAKEMMKVDPENIVFHKLPGNENDYVYQGGDWVSYVTIYPYEWLDMLNEYLNPYADDITIEELSILTKDANGYVYSTNGVYQGYSSWGNYSAPEYSDDDTESGEEPTEPDEPGGDEPVEPDNPDPVGGDEPSGGDDPVGGDEPVEGGESQQGGSEESPAPWSE